MPMKISRRLQEIKNSLTGAYAANQHALCKLMGIKNPRTQVESNAYLAEVVKWKSGKVELKPIQMGNFKKLAAERDCLDNLMKSYDRILAKFGLDANVR
jgi:hypothetical protein